MNNKAMAVIIGIIKTVDKVGSIETGAMFLALRMVVPSWSPAMHVETVETLVEAGFLCIDSDFIVTVSPKAKALIEQDKAEAVAMPWFTMPQAEG